MELTCKLQRSGLSILKKEYEVAAGLPVENGQASRGPVYFQL